jgi:hypothetical protein
MYASGIIKVNRVSMKNITWRLYTPGFPRIFQGLIVFPNYSHPNCIARNPFISHAMVLIDPDFIDSFRWGSIGV